MDELRLEPGDVDVAVVLGLFWGLTAAARALQEPDLGDPDTLSPTGAGRDGSSRLAELLTARGIRIERVTSTKDAIWLAAREDATIFAPAPDFLHPTFVELAQALPGEHRVVLVKPGLRAFTLQRTPVFDLGDRWATGVTAPRCDTSRLGPSGGAAGPASLRRARYEPVDARDMSINCYGGGVVGVRSAGTEVVVVGATEPFRNGRIGEQTNEAVAVALLSVHPTLIWLDLHANEKIAAPEVDLPPLPQYRREDRNRTSTGNSVIDAFPATLWVLLLLAAAVAVLLAVARARRLGGPVAEPLPVLVPAAESVTGRGRLYQRIQARQATLDALRGAAIRRITPVLNPFGAAAPSTDQLIVQIAQRVGYPEHAVRAILFGPAPDTDALLAAAVQDLDELVIAVMHDTNQPPTRRVAPQRPGAPEQGGPA